MSRIAKNPIKISNDVTCSFNQGVFSAKGKLGELKIIVNDYDRTIFVEEALHRLVEIHYHIGLEKEAKKFASILGYNYNSSEWFAQSYKVLNKDYNFKKVEKNKSDKALFDKILEIIKIN